MNQSDPFDLVDDEDVESLLSLLRQIEPPVLARAEFRTAVAAELECGTVHRHTPWWRRSIAVPAPVAASAAVLLCASIAWAVIRSPADGGNAADSPPRLTPVAPAPALHEPMALAELRRVPPSMNVEHTTTEIYVCGVGPVKSTSRYIVRE